MVGKYQQDATQMAHTQKQQFPRKGASQNRVLRVVMIWMLFIALVFPFSLDNAAIFHNTAPLHHTSVAQIEEGIVRDAQTKMATHCGQQSSCGFAMLIVRPLNLSGVKSVAILPVPEAKALGWISGPPGHPPKAIIIT